MQEILSTIIYSCLGIILMMAGTFIVDLIVPCHFPTEIKNGNQSVGYITAGSSIAVGIILKGAVISPSTIEITQGLLEGVGSTMLYFFIGIIFCIIGYLVMKVFNKKYDLNKEITNGNPAAGLMVMGMFIGLAILISGVIY
jgi:putative membrane protein